MLNKLINQTKLSNKSISSTIPNITKLTHANNKQTVNPNSLTINTKTQANKNQTNQNITNVIPICINLNTITKANKTKHKSIPKKHATRCKETQTKQFKQANTHTIQNPKTPNQINRQIIANSTTQSSKQV